MVNARLHIICGNCGSNDMLKLRVVEDDVYVACDNCATLHDLDSELLRDEFSALKEIE